MFRLVKNLAKITFLFVSNYVRKGKMLHLFLPLIMLSCFFGGAFATKTFFAPKADICLSELEMFDKEITPNLMGVDVNYQPSVSKDARFITFSAIKVEINKVKDIEIKLYDKKTKKYVDLPGINSKGWDLAPSISADGRYIAFQSNRNGKTRWDIFLYDTKAKKLVPLPNINSILPDFNPSISPDGKYITYNSVRSLIPKIYLYDVGGRKVVPLTEDEAK